MAAAYGAQNSGLAVGVAVLFVYFFYYIFMALALFGTKIKAEDLRSRCGRIHLFGILGVFALYVATAFSGVLSWLTCISILILFFGAAITSDESQKRWLNLGDLIFSSFLTAWYIGALALAFENFPK